MFLLTASEMRELDRKTIEGGHVSGTELMERAGRGVYDIIRQRFSSRLERRRIVLLCGKGNNAGDGFVIARHLMEAGALVTLFLLAPPAELQGDARDAFEKLLPLQPEIFPLSDDAGRSLCAQQLEACDLAIDALFGTGLKGGLREPGLSAVNILNRHAPRVLSVDLPSGLSGDDESVEVCVEADLTATIGFAKTGLCGEPRCGEILRVDIGFPPDLSAKTAGDLRALDAEEARKRLPLVSSREHKYQRGSVLIVAGSTAYGGAPLLTASAALRSGAGMVRLALPASLVPLLQARLPSVIAHSLPEEEDGSLGEAAFEELSRLEPRWDALGIGPGLGRSPETLLSLRQWLEAVEIPAVIDADALFAWKEDFDALSLHPAPRVLTPHSGELGALLGKSSQKVNRQRMKILRSLDPGNRVLLHKGAATMIRGGGAEIYGLLSGHPSMARGGSGDLLTGLIAGILAQGSEPLDATLLAAWIHGEAGRRAGISRGRAAQSEDLIPEFAAAWHQLENPLSVTWDDE
ncbi:MAG: NAD(P)H-hydrate dehydratase [Candidatus Krumholzibacteria bacterium]|nr:NAD(P)H-hydrate dehydratase [Candidatus Krumholzibacteria bacterium]